MPRGSVNVSAGGGPPLDIFTLDSGIIVPFTALRGMGVDGLPKDLAASVDGELRVAHGDENPPRALQYARDAGDRMRVIIDAAGATQPVSGSISSRTAWANNDGYTNWYSSGAPASMDAREQQRELSMHTFMNQRARWTIT